MVVALRAEEEEDVKRMTRTVRPVALALLAATTLVACAPQTPPVTSGTGFDSLQAAAARDAALQGYDPEAVSGSVGAPLSATGPAPLPGSAEATAAETARVLAETRPAPVAGAPLEPVATVDTGTVANRLGISNENDFDAVADQRSIEGDAARLAQSRAQYEVIAPQPLPQRSGDQPNIVAFALSTSHPVGERVYARAGFNGAARAERNCRDYPSPAEAQIDFLARGGPERDRLGLDPDGDGYACTWDPAPFRRASQG
jgi:hypothetical protein